MHMNEEGNRQRARLTADYLLSERLLERGP
jgi:hypothetical protein